MSENVREPKKNSKLVTSVSFSRENNKQSDGLGNSKLPLDRRKGEELDNNSNYNVKVENEKTTGSSRREIKQNNDNPNTPDVIKAAHKRSVKIELQEDENVNDSDEENEKKQSKKYDKKVEAKRSKKVKGGNEGDSNERKENMQTKYKKNVLDKETSPSSSPKKKAEKNKRHKEEEAEDEVIFFVIAYFIK